MSEGITLFFILLVFYLAECVFWLNKNCAAFMSLAGRRWNLIFPDRFFGNDNGGIVFANPLPPLGNIYLCSLLPLSLSNTHVCSQISQTLINDIKTDKNVKSIKYNEIKSVTAIDKEIYINGDVFLKCGSPVYAIHIKNILKKLIALNDEQREKEVTNIVRDILDVEAAKNRIKSFTDKSRNLRIFCNVLFMYGFIIAPAAIYFLGTIKLFISLLLLMYLLSVSISFFYYRVHKIFYPGQRGERLIETIKMIIFPPAAVRAIDLLSLNLLINYHPLTLARILFDETEFRNVAKKVVIDMTYPAIDSYENVEIAEANKWHGCNMEKAVTDFLQINNVDTNKLLNAPTPENDSCKSFCPRCETQYADHGGTCSDCRTIALVQFKSKKVHAKKSKNKKRRK